MADPSQKSGSKSQVPDKIFLRRGNKKPRHFPTRLVFQAIKGGNLLATDEYSFDGKKWAQLGSHKQLAKLLNKNPSAKEIDLAQAVKAPPISSKKDPAQDIEEPGPPPPGLNDDLEKLAELLKGINTGF